jgi:hypothetical protein
LQPVGQLNVGRGILAFALFLDGLSEIEYRLPDDVFHHFHDPDLAPLRPGAYASKHDPQKLDPSGKIMRKIGPGPVALGGFDK